MYLNIVGSLSMEILTMTHTVYDRPGFILIPEDAMSPKPKILKALLNSFEILMIPFSQICSFHSYFQDEGIELIHTHYLTWSV